MTQYCDKLRHCEKVEKLRSKRWETDWQFNRALYDLCSKCEDYPYQQERMTDDQINAICTERLGRWQKGLIEQHATPVLLVSVGHDEKKGQIVLSTTEEMQYEEIILFLEGALNLLKTGSRIQ